MSDHDNPTIQLEVNGQQVEVPDDGASLLEVLRDRVGLCSVKDGCSPQGQCGCCTVLVDGAARVSCVTPARRVDGRSVTTYEGLPEPARSTWEQAFTACGASQCGFCTPGILVRLEALRVHGDDLGDAALVHKALLAHLCRCTGWQTITEAAACVATGEPPDEAGRDLLAATARATLEGHTAQQVSPVVAAGGAGFADDTAPRDALVAVQGATGDWVVAPTLHEARQLAGKVQGRRGTVAARPPLTAPEGAWDAVLRTSWVEPAYVETDASWCAPGRDPADPLANGGAFGAKRDSEVADVARRLADEHGTAVRVLYSREDTVRLGPKRPPVAGGANADGTGVLLVARTPGIAAAVHAVAPGLEVREVDVAGPRTDAGLRAAGWAEALVLLAGAAVPGTGREGSADAGAALVAPGEAVDDNVPAPGEVGDDDVPIPGVEVLEGGKVRVLSPGGGIAEARVEADGSLSVLVDAGALLDGIVLRSYVIGAAHQAVSWITSEGLAVDADGEVLDLTVRSFGVLRAVDTPRISVELVASDRDAVNGSDAAFVAVAAAVWRSLGCPAELPAATSRA